MTAKTKKRSKRVSNALKNKLPADERENASEILWNKSNGKCALCDQPLGTNIDLITADHRVAGGKDTLSNLYLAHRSCNSSRGDIEFDRVRPLIEFKVYAEKKVSVTFGDVISRYLVH